MHLPMLLICPECQTKYAVAPNAIPVAGRTVKCAKCAHEWFQKGEEAAATVLEPTVEVPPTRPVALIGTVKEKQTPGWLKVASLLLGIAVLGMGAVMMEPVLRPVLGGVYSLIGITPSDGLQFSDVTFKVQPGKSENRVFITGAVRNNAAEPRSMSTVRVGLFDENHQLLQEAEYKQGHVQIEPGASMPFSIELPSHSKRIEFIQIDVGNGWQLAVRE